jgi:prepilin-type N-terminal cleavage/methylation domain-containing protein
MLQKYKTKREEGFTIIEVLIVLAIAGLIILIVFLAVPALQRNSRNTQRNNDASLIAGAINECLNNRNGQQGSCDEFSKISPDYLDTSKLRQLETVAKGNTLPSDNKSANFAFEAKCKSDGSGVETTGVSKRQFVVLYNTENTSGGNVARCLEG